MLLTWMHAWSRQSIHPDEEELREKREVLVYCSPLTPLSFILLSFPALVTVRLLYASPNANSGVGKLLPRSPMQLKSFIAVR